MQDQSTDAHNRGCEATSDDPNAGGELVALMGRFGMLSEYVMDNASHGAQALYGRLAMMASGGQAWPGVAWLAERLGVSDRTVRRWCEELRGIGVLRVQARFRADGSQMSNRYLVSPAPIPMLAGTVDQGADTDVRPPRTQVSAHEIDQGEKETPLPPRTAGGTAGRRTRATPTDAEREQVRAVFAAWREHLHPKAKPTRERSRRVLARLREGYSAAELVEAVRGCAGSQFHREGHHTDLTLICRDAPHVDRFRALYADQQRTTAGARGSSPAGPRLTADQEALRDLRAWLQLHPEDADAAARAVDLAARIERTSPVPNLEEGCLARR